MLEMNTRNRRDFPSIGFLVPPSLHFCTPLPFSSRSARPPSLFTILAAALGPPAYRPNLTH